MLIRSSKEREHRNYLRKESASWDADLNKLNDSLNLDWFHNYLYLITIWPKEIPTRLDQTKLCWFDVRNASCAARQNESLYWQTDFSPNRFFEHTNAKAREWSQAHSNPCVSVELIPLYSTTVASINAHPFLQGTRTQKLSPQGECVVGRWSQ